MLFAVNNYMAAEIITKEDLQLFKEELLKEIKLLFDKPEKINNEWLRTRQVRTILGISPNTLQGLRISGKIRFTKIGSIHYYKASEIKQLLEGS
jgi:ribonucleotide reductase beta subunit family protein with ferritin-like domain